MVRIESSPFLLEVIMSSRLSIVLSEEEWEELWEICDKDLRHPAEEIRHLLREEVKKRNVESKNQESVNIKKENLC